MVVQHSGQCLTPADSSGAVNTPVVQNPCTGQAAERWTFQPVTGGYQMVSSQSGKCGTIDWIKVATFEDSGKCKGYGWVKFREPEAAAWAVNPWITTMLGMNSGGSRWRFAR